MLVIYKFLQYGLMLASLGTWIAALPVKVLRNDAFGHPGLTIAKRELDFEEEHQRVQRSLLLPLLLSSAVSGRNAGNRYQGPPLAILPNDGSPNAYSPFNTDPFGGQGLSNPFSHGLDNNIFGNNNNPFAPVGMNTHNVIPATNPLLAVNPLLATNPTNIGIGSNPSDVLSLLSQNPNILGGQSGAVGDVLSRLLHGLTNSLGGTLSGLLGAGNQNPNPVIPPVNPVNPPVSPPVVPPVSPPATVPAGGKR